MGWNYLSIPTIYKAGDYFSMLGLKLIHVSKRGPEDKAIITTKVNQVRNNFVYAPSQWETTLPCNVVSHWLGAFTIWSLPSSVMHMKSLGLNSLAPERYSCTCKFVKFQTYIKERYLSHFKWNCPLVNATRLHWRLANIASGNDLPWGNKPLSEPMSTTFYIATRHH